MLNSFLLFSQFVVLVHRSVDALQYKALDDFHAQVEGWLQLAHILLSVMPQYPVYLSASRIVVADAHAQTGIVLSDELLDVAQSVVTAITATCFQAEGT